MAVPCAPTGDKQVQLRRGTTAENNAFIGADGELSFDTDQNRLRVHDGVTPGGYPIALFSDIVAGSSPPFVDTTNIIMGSADNTKLLRFEVDGFTAATTRTLTPQDASYILAGTNISNIFSVDQAVGPAAQIVLNANGSALFASGEITITAGGDMIFGAATIQLFATDGSATFGGGDLVILADGAVTINSNIALNADGSAAFGTAGLLTISAAGLITFPDNLRQIFNPGATNAGINVGALAGDPSAPVNGDLWYDSVSNELTARINGVNVALGAGGGGSPPFSDSTALVMGSATPSKLLRFEVDGFTAATTRVLTPQNADYIIAGTDITNSFTVQQSFDGDAGIFIGTMLLTDPSSNGTLVITNGGLMLTVGNRLVIEAGSNQRAGNAVLVAGTVTVNNTSVTPDTIVLLTRKTSGGTPGTLITYTVSAGSSFTINSDSALDTSTFSYFLIEVL